MAENKTRWPVCCHCGRKDTLKLMSCRIVGINVPITDAGYKLDLKDVKIEDECAQCSECGMVNVLCAAHTDAISAEYLGTVKVQDPEQEEPVVMDLWVDPRGGHFALEVKGKFQERVIGSPFALERHILLKK
jgi:hypothetical protein